MGVGGMGVYTSPHGPPYLRPKLVGGYGNFFHVVKNFSEKPATFFLFFARRRRNFWVLGGIYPPQPEVATLPNGKNVPMSGHVPPAHSQLAVVLYTVHKVEMTIPKVLSP
jgi:hypothetical protein